MNTTSLPSDNRRLRCHKHLFCEEKRSDGHWSFMPSDFKQWQKDSPYGAWSDATSRENRAVVLREPSDASRNERPFIWRVLYN